MTRTKKSLLTASTIITIVASSFAILIGFVCMFLGSMFTEAFFKETYSADPAYTLYEEADGSYYFSYIETDGSEVRIYDEEISLTATIASNVANFAGFMILGLGVAKLVLAIRILLLKNRDKYSMGCVIALLVLSIIGFNVLESVFLIVTMCLKDEYKVENVEEPNITEIKTKE